MCAQASAGRGLKQFSPAQAQNLANLQAQATAAQQAQTQAALQLQQAQTQVAAASDQLAGQTQQLASVSNAQQANQAELSVLLPTSPTGAPTPGPQSAAGACTCPCPARARHARSATRGTRRHSSLGCYAASARGTPHLPRARVCAPPKPARVCGARGAGCLLLSRAAYWERARIRAYVATTRAFLAQAPVADASLCPAAAAMKRLEANSAMEGGIANVARTFVYSPPPPMQESPPPPLQESSPPPPKPSVGFSAPAADVQKKGEVSFAPGTVTYWETVAAPAPAPAHARGSGARQLHQASSESGAYRQAVLQQQQQIQASNAQAQQDAAQAAHDQYAAENMQLQQRNAEANAEADQASLLVQSQVLAALTPAPAPAPAPSTASTDLKSKEAKAGMQGGVANMASRRLQQAAPSLSSVMEGAASLQQQEVSALDAEEASTVSAQTASNSAQQSSEQAAAQVNDATDNAQLTGQEASKTNQATQQPKIPTLASFAPSPPPAAHAQLKEKEKKAELTGGVAAGSR